MSDLSLSTPTPDDELIQPGDPDAEVPPVYSAGNLPEGEPREAVTRQRPVFYGPVTGPFTVNSKGELLQAPEDWIGFIRLDPQGNVLHVHETQFHKHYQWTDEAGIASVDEGVRETIGDLEDALAEAQTRVADLELQVGGDEGPAKDDDDTTLLQPDE